MKAFALQQAVYNKLAASASLMTAVSNRLYSDAPQISDAAGGFPQIVIGADVFTPWDTKGGNGASVIVQIDVYSRTAGWKEVKDIADAVYSLVHRQALTISGGAWIETDMETASMSIDPDGKTRRSLMLFRVIYDEIV